MKAEILKVINECSVNPISNTSERIIHEDDFEYLADEINSLLSNKESEEEKDCSHKLTTWEPMVQKYRCAQCLKWL